MDASTSIQTERQRLREELARQHDVAAREQYQRIGLSLLAYALCAPFTNATLILVFAVINVVAEFAISHYGRDLDPEATPWRYKMCLAMMCLMEASLMLAAGLVWLQDDDMAKALATGIASATLLQLSTVRSIHLPFAIAGLITAGALAVVFNSLYWLPNKEWTGLILSNLAVFAAISYAGVASVSGYRFHRSMAAIAATAQASDAAKGRFLAQMSHELRTPLNAIIGLGEVEAATTKGASRERLNTLVASARDLAIMLDDLLDLSMSEERKLRIKPRPVKAGAELKLLADSFEAQARAAGCRLALSFAGLPASSLMIDPQRMRQCLSNLVSNAMRHAPGSSIRILAGYSSNLLFVDVADDGPGVPQEIVDRIFEPFFRGTPDAPGIGLGLAISRSLARHMGGDLRLIPSVRGATFRLELPAFMTEEQQISPRLPVLTGQTILVVDDISTNRLVATNLLASTGATFVEARSGAEAIAQLEKGGIDLVLLDMMMPDMDGLETCRRIRKMPGGQIPVIAMTANVQTEHRETAMAAGLDGFIAKPLLPENFAAVLGPLLERKAPKQDSSWRG